MGVMALTGFMSAAGVGANTSGLSVVDDFFKRQNQIPAPMVLNQCENKSWLDELLSKPIYLDNLACENTASQDNAEEGQLYVQK
jgi:hypothetical protein